MHFQIFKLELKVDLIDFISFVGLKFKKCHFNDSNLVSELELVVSKIHCIEFRVTNIFFFKYNTVTSMRQVSLSSSTYTFTKTLHKKIWMKSMCVHQLSFDNVIREAKKLPRAHAHSQAQIRNTLRARILL